MLQCQGAGWVGGSLGTRRWELWGLRCGGLAKPGSQARPTAPDRSRQLGGTGAVLDPHTGHLPGDQDMLRPGWDVGPQLSPAKRSPWPAGRGCGKMETLWSHWDTG